MTPKQFEEIFDKVNAEAGCLETIRRYVLSVAIQGKLVSQNKLDEPAPELLKRILIVKSKNPSAAGRARRVDTEAFNHLKYEIPDSWKWTTLTEIGHVNPKIEADDHKTASFVEMASIFAEYGHSHLSKAKPWAKIKTGFTRFCEGDVGLAKITPCFENGKSAIFTNLENGIGAGTTELLVVRPYLVEPRYVLAFLKSGFFIGNGIPLMTGTAGQKRVPSAYFSACPFPLPPLEEQKRIVAKVNELMALCDELERSQKKTATIQKDFVASSLLKLQTDSARTFEELIEANLNYFSDKADLLHHTKNELVSLAIQGKFLKGGSTHPTFIPLGELCSKTGSGSTPRGGKSVYQDSGIALLRSQNIYNDGLRLNDVALISEATHEKMKGTKVYPGDLLLNITGGSIGRCCIVPDDTPEMNVSQHVSIVRLKDKDLAHFLHLVITSPYFQSHIMNEQTGAGREGLPKKKMDLIPIPIFGSSEQQEITEQAHKIVTLFDQLEISVKKEVAIKADLLKSLVA